MVIYMLVIFERRHLWGYKLLYKATAFVKVCILQNKRYETYRC